MDVCADLSPHHAPAIDPAEEAAFYGVVLKYLTEMAVRVADKVETAPDMTVAQKVTAITAIATIARRNAVTARYLHEPIRTTPPPSRASGQPGRRDYPRKPDGSVDCRQCTDAELDEIIEREEAEERERERREARERVEPLPPLPNQPDAETTATASGKPAPSEPDSPEPGRDAPGPPSTEYRAPPGCPGAPSPDPDTS